jgi:heparanase 1
MQNNLIPIFTSVLLMSFVVFGNTVNTEIITTEPPRKIDRRFLSFSIDTANFLGIKFWNSDQAPTQKLNLEDPFLQQVTKNLSPAYLRIGGSDADKIIYDFQNTTGINNAPLPPHTSGTFRTSDWERLQAFTSATQTALIFTINAGPSARIANGSWNGSNFRELLLFSQERQDAPVVWEFGNEVNAHWLHFGVQNQISAATYAHDFQTARNLISSIRPRDRIVGPASAYWPILGEPIPWLTEILPGFLKNADFPLDVITWHFYPTQSDRCGFGVRKANQEQFYKLETFNEVRQWAFNIRQERDRFHPQAKIWLGESGPAQCGGQPKLSNRFLSTLWWLDHLGTIAYMGNEVLVRQSLIGSDYGLLDQTSGQPNPDYWSAILWKQLMGDRVFGVQGMNTLNPGTTRIYSHCLPLTSPYRNLGDLSLLYINLSPVEETWVTLPTDLIEPSSLWHQWQMTSTSPLSQKLKINGDTPIILNNGYLPDLAPLNYNIQQTPTLKLPPLSAAFVLVQSTEKIHKICK